MYWPFGSSSTKWCASPFLYASHWLAGSSSASWRGSWATSATQSSLITPRQGPRDMSTPAAFACSYARLARPIVSASASFPPQPATTTNASTSAVRRLRRRPAETERDALVVAAARVPAGYIGLLEIVDLPAEERAVERACAVGVGNAELEVRRFAAHDAVMNIHLWPSTSSAE